MDSGGGGLRRQIELLRLSLLILLVCHLSLQCEDPLGVILVEGMEEKG